MTDISYEEAKAIVESHEGHESPPKKGMSCTGCLVAFLVVDGILSFFIGAVIPALLLLILAAIIYSCTNK